MQQQQQTQKQKQTSSSPTILGTEARQKELHSFALNHLKMVRILDSLKEIHTEHTLLSKSNNQNQALKESVFNLLQKFEQPSSKLLCTSGAIQGFISQFNDDEKQKQAKNKKKKNGNNHQHNSFNDEDDDGSQQKRHHQNENDDDDEDDEEDSSNSSFCFMTEKNAPKGLFEALLAPDSLDFVQMITNDKDIAMLIPVFSFLLENFMLTMNSSHYVENDEDNTDGTKNNNKKMNNKQKVNTNNNKNQRRFQYDDNHHLELEDNNNTDNDQLFFFSTASCQKALEQLSSIVEIISDIFLQKFARHNDDSDGNSNNQNNNQDDDDGHKRFDSHIVLVFAMNNGNNIHQQQFRRHLRRLSKVCAQVAEFLHQSLQQQPQIMNLQQKLSSAIAEHLFQAAKKLNPAF